MLLGWNLQSQVKMPSPISPNPTVRWTRSHQASDSWLASKQMTRSKALEKFADRQPLPLLFHSDAYDADR